MVYDSRVQIKENVDLERDKEANREDYEEEVASFKRCVQSVDMRITCIKVVKKYSETSCVILTAISSETWSVVLDFHRKGFPKVPKLADLTIKVRS